MTTKLYPLKIKEVKKETDDCVSLAFDIPQELLETFTYKQGQYLTLEGSIFGEKVRRAYSLCSSPLEKEWRVAIKKVPQGKFSSYANDILVSGDRLDVMPPQGKFFTEFKAEQKKNYLLVAAGSGITPILSILKTGLLSEPLSTFTLIYGNKGRQSIIFFEEIEALKNTYLNRLSIHHIFSREELDSPVHNGRIDGNKIDELAKGLVDIAQIDEVFICGPALMTQSLREKLPTLGIEAKHIHFELFATPGQEAGKEKIVEVDPGIAEKQAEVSVKLDGKTIVFPLEFGGKNILDAAMEKGADLPYACKGGVCCTCRAKLIEGEVDMEVNFGLEPDEVEAGFILTCQAHPRSEKVQVDFDQQ